jgi:NTP pyrophosphatase (non-canonical NTP hydrolase)
MNLNEYQKLALITLIKNNEEHLTYGLAAEVGEILSLMQKYHRGDKRYFNEEATFYKSLKTDLMKEKLFNEFGDVLWYLSCLCNFYGFKLDDIAKNNLEKLSIRFSENKIQGDGDNR